MNNRFTLGKHLKKYALWYVLAVSMILISVSLSMFMPQVALRIVDDVIVGGNYDILLKLLTIYLLLGAGRMVFQYTKEFLFDWISASISCRLRRDLFVHIQGLDT